MDNKTENQPRISSVARLLLFIEQLGLLIILLATVVAIGQEVMEMIRHLQVRLADLLLLFIYLEVLAMIGIYYQSHQVPVRFPLYIAIVALARYVILDSKTLSAEGLLSLGGTILLLALSVLVVRFGHFRYPYGETPRESHD